MLGKERFVFELASTCSALVDIAHQIHAAPYHTDMTLYRYFFIIFCLLQFHTHSKCKFYSYANMERRLIDQQTYHVVLVILIGEELLRATNLSYGSCNSYQEKISEQQTCHVVLVILIGEELLRAQTCHVHL